MIEIGPNLACAIGAICVLIFFIVLIIAFFKHLSKIEIESLGDVLDKCQRPNEMWKCNTPDCYIHNAPPEQSNTKSKGVKI